MQILLFEKYGVTPKYRLINIDYCTVDENGNLITTDFFGVRKCYRKGEDFDSLRFLY